MQTPRQVAENYIHLLGATRPSSYVLESSVTKKGGAPAQTAKQIVLGRLTHADTKEPLSRIKGDMYAHRLNGEATLFRFAVTTSHDAIPWLNLTEAELETLSRQRAIILVVWNPDEPGRWCSELVVFALPPDELLSSYRVNSGRILQSMLRAAYKKLEKENTVLPGLFKAISERMDLAILQEPEAPGEVLISFRKTFVDIISNYVNGLLTVAELSAEEKRAALKLRERMFALLVQIERYQDGDSYIARHHKTASDLLHLDETLFCEITLGEAEAKALQGAYDEIEASGQDTSSADGIEEEHPSDGVESIKSPYDAAKSKIDTRVVTIDLLVKRIRGDEIDLEPPFQRKGGLWSPKQESQLIESLLIRVPLPAFYFDATNDERWLVVDGLQRLTAFKDFLVGSMRLAGLEYLTQYNDRRFSELPRALQRIIEESQVTVHLIQPGTPAEVKFNIFRRINTGGIPLTLQEIRHALNQGKVTKLLEGLAASNEFLEATTHSISSDRMADRELVLRFLAFTVTDYGEYRVPDIDAFLSAQMGRLNKLEVRYPELRERFLRSMKAAKAIFANQAFRKMYFLHQARSPINKALFESWSTALGNLSEGELQRIISRKDEVVNGAIKLCNDDEFHRAISQGTQDVAKVRKRFEAVQKLLAQTLN